jgi:hypothetical protein
VESLSFEITRGLVTTNSMVIIARARIVRYVDGRLAMLHYVGIEAFRATPLIKEPFEHLIVERFIGPSAPAETPTIQIIVRKFFN